MESPKTEKIVNKYDEAPRRQTREEEADNCRLNVAYEKSVPVFGRWTYMMLSSLRRMWGEADLAGDGKLRKRIEAAYDYLYTRDQRIKWTRNSDSQSARPSARGSPSLWKSAGK